MPVIDAFPGNNETKLAALRIEYLSPIVDFTVIGESTLTHSGKMKPLFFTEWLEGVDNREFREKIILIELDLSNFVTSWEREIATREHIANYVRTHFPDSHFILSDLDEIPSISQIDHATKFEKHFHFLTPTSYLFANWQPNDSHKRWSRGVIGHTSLGLGPNGGRFAKWPVIESRPGAHLSWMLGVSGELGTKALSTAHEELESQKVLDSELISFASKFGVDHLGRFYEEGFGVLKIQQKTDLSDVQSFMLLKTPSYFRFELEVSNIFFRWFASSVCTTMWNKPKYREMLGQTFIQRKISVMTSLIATMFLFQTIIFGLIHSIKRSYRLLLNLSGN